MHRRDIQKSREDAVKVNQNEENNGTTHAGVDGPLVLSVETVDDDEVSGSSRFCAEGAPCHTCIGHSSDSLSTASSSSSSSSPSPSSSSSKAVAFTSWSRCEKSNECNVDRKGENGHDIISNLLMQNEEGGQCKVAQSMEVQSTKKIDVVGATNHSSATNNQQHELMSLKQLYDQILRTAHETTTTTIPAAASTMDVQIKDKWESCSKFAKEARGPRFLLLSAGAFASALGASCIRWVLSETGEVLMLFFVVDKGNGISGGLHHGDIELSRHDLENMGVDPDFIADAPCFEGNDNKMRLILLHMAWYVHRAALTLSPHLRVTTLVLLFLSTASFLLGVVLTKRELQKFFDVVIYRGLYREILHQTLYEDVWCETIHPVLEISRTLGKSFWMHLRQDVSGEVERWMDSILKFLVHVNRVYLTSSRGFSETLPQLTTVSSNPSESSRSKLNMQQKLQHIINISKVTQTNLQTKLVQTTQRVISSTDQLVLDDLLRKCHQRGLEMMGGVIGALVLYGVPDEIFPSTPPLPSSKLLEYSSSPSVELSSKVIEIQGTGSKSSNERNNDVIYDQNKGMKRTRQRIVKSIDPALESILFQPGGVWAAMPMGGELREYLKRLVVAGNVSLLGDQKNLLKVQSITECDCDAASRDGCGSGEGKGEPVEMPYSETIGEVLTSTLRDIIEPNVPSPFPPPISGADKQQAPSGVNKMDTNLSCQNARPPTPISPQTPFPHVEKILDRMTVASVLLFLFHIRSSQITRKAWWSAVQFSISTGILGVALGTGLASRTLGSEYVKSTIKRNPVLKMICFRVWESLPISGYCRNLSELSCSVEDTLKCWFLRMKEELKEKKHLQMILAIFIFYGVRRLPRLSAGKGGYISTVCGRYTAGRSKRDVRKIRYGD